VYCDLMHDVLEGVCRYVLVALLNCLISEKMLFTLDTLNSRIAAFSYDHSSRPPCLSIDQLKKRSLIMSAIEMLNLVLSLNLRIGDLVVDNDDEWQVFLLLRKLVLYCCGLNFSAEELVHLEFIVAEFLQEYMSVFGGPLTQKFHNLIHYPRVVRYLGPMYFNWVMRREAKHSELKKAAQSSGNFKNICRTLAVRQQMKQAERFFACRGLEESCFEFANCRVQHITLSDVVNGSKISELLGGYGLYRELYKIESVVINSVCFECGDVLVDVQDDIFTTFLQIHSVFVTDCKECFILCSKLCTVIESYHLQAYEVLLSDELCIVSAGSVCNLASPWPVKLRALKGLFYVSLRHKI